MWQGFLIKRLNFVFSVLVRGKISQEPGVISKTPKRFYINKNLKLLFRFVVDCHPSAVRPSMSISGHRWTWLEWAVFKISRFRFQNAPEHVMKVFLSRVQVHDFFFLIC